jgi:hypothetical protein
MYFLRVTDETMGGMICESARIKILIFQFYQFCESAQTREDTGIQIDFYGVSPGGVM